MRLVRRRRGYTASRPAYSALGSERGLLLPSLADALTRHAGLRAERNARTGEVRRMPHRG